MLHFCFAFLYEWRDPWNGTFCVRFWFPNGALSPCSPASLSPHMATWAVGSWVMVHGSWSTLHTLHKKKHQGRIIAVKVAFMSTCWIIKWQMRPYGFVDQSRRVKSIWPQVPFKCIIWERGIVLTFSNCPFHWPDQELWFINFLEVSF